MNDKLSESAGRDSVPVSRGPQVNGSDNSADLITNVRRAPGNQRHWDAVDDDARNTDDPERGERIYDELLPSPMLSQPGLPVVSERYVAFLEGWSDDAEKPISVLRRV